MITLVSEGAAQDFTIDAHFFTDSPALQRMQQPQELQPHHHHSTTTTNNNNNRRIHQYRRINQYDDDALYDKLRIINTTTTVVVRQTMHTPHTLTMNFETKSVWDHLDIALPDLELALNEVKTQEKGSTEWAAHSHSPVSLQEWDNFDELISIESEKTENQEDRKLMGLHEVVQLFVPWNKVKQEEDVTDRTLALLNTGTKDQFKLWGRYEFGKATKHILAKPDIIAEENNDETWGTGTISDYESPKKGGKAAQRRALAKAAKKLYRFPFETKPWWKLGFLTGRDRNQTTIISEWEMPVGYTASDIAENRALPDTWSREKRKIFHVVRQIYGQMVTDQRRYGILHTYECWFFCKRDSDGIFYISRGFLKDETGPSVLHGIKTLLGFDDFVLKEVTRHDASPSKAPVKPEEGNGKPSGNARLPPSYGEAKKNLWGNNDGPDGSGGCGSCSSTTAGLKDDINLAFGLCPWECKHIDATEKVQLLTPEPYPDVLVKMQRDARQTHVASMMKNECRIYQVLAGAKYVDKIAPRFYGFSAHLGVAIICVEREGDNFDDIGIENLSISLKRSALSCIEILSKIGVLHNDIALRNFVQCRKNPQEARVIDFGLSCFTSDQLKLKSQVGDAKRVLGLDPSGGTSQAEI